MKLILVRHAPAGEPNANKYPDDRARPLTKVGIKKFKKAAAGLGKLVKPEYVMCSPMARTMMTADLMNWDGGWPAPVANEVLDGSPPKGVLKAVKSIEGMPDTVGLVGHGPDLENLARYLLGSAEELDFQKGGAMLIETPGRAVNPGTGVLKWAMRRKELKQHR